MSYRCRYADVLDVEARSMGGGGQRARLTPRLAWMFAAIFLCAILPARVAVALYWIGWAGVAAVLALFLLPLLYTIPRGRVLWARHRNWLLAAQAGLTYLPFVVFGQRWVLGLSGLLGGLLLLLLAAPASWILFGAILAVEAVLRIGVFGNVQIPGESMTSWVFTVWATTSRSSSSSSTATSVSRRMRMSSATRTLTTCPSTYDDATDPDGTGAFLLPREGLIGGGVGGGLTAFGRG
jgi:hypothetical protein